MSDEDRAKIANEVNVIFHCAATIRFDEALKKAVLLNTRGCKYMMDLAVECKKLEVNFGFVFFELRKIAGYIISGVLPRFNCLLSFRRESVI